MRSWVSSLGRRASFTDAGTAAGILIYRHDGLLYANRHFLEWTGYEDLAALEAAGGLSNLFAGPVTGALAETSGAPSLSIMTRGGDRLPAEGRMFTLPWNGSSALALILTNGQAAAGHRETETALGSNRDENRELKAILDAATDGVVTLDADGRAVAANTRAAALFGHAFHLHDGESRMVALRRPDHLYGSKAEMNFKALAALVIVPFITGAIVGWRLWSLKGRTRNRRVK